MEQTVAVLVAVTTPHTHTSPCRKVGRTSVVQGQCSFADHLTPFNHKRHERLMGGLFAAVSLLHWKHDTHMPLQNTIPQPIVCSNSLEFSLPSLCPFPGRIPIERYRPFPSNKKHNKSFF